MKYIYNCKRIKKRNKERGRNQKNLASEMFMSCHHSWVKYFFFWEVDQSNKIRRMSKLLFLEVFRLEFFRRREMDKKIETTQIS
jgi:hypothetical protein